jgi:hypothetical protein
MSHRPGFLCIGAQKSGTSWLYRNFQAHPSIWVTRVKELHYFDEKAQSGYRPPIHELLFSRNHKARRWRRQFRMSLLALRHEERLFAAVQWNTRFFFGMPSDKWYLSLFDPDPRQVAGEITPDYSILDVERVAHVRRVLPRR